MDRSLDEIINSRESRPRGGARGGRRPRDEYVPSGGRRDGGRAPRRDDYPRDGIKKSYPSDNAGSIDRDWVHDKFEDEDGGRQSRRPRNDTHADYDSRSARQSSGVPTVRIDNLHYELREDDLYTLFDRLQLPVSNVRVLYDRSDRSQGTAFATFTSPSYADRAIREMDGARAMGQELRVSMAASRPAPSRNPFDHVEKPSRSLFDRIDTDEPRRGGRRRSASPVGDSYVPGERRGRSRSPVRRGAGRPRETGRRPGARREATGERGERGGRGGRGAGAGARGRADGEGRQLVGGRPRKTAEELDAEMDNYWGAPAAETDATANATQAASQDNGAGEPQTQNPGSGTAAAAGGDYDIDLMVE